MSIIDEINQNYMFKSIGTSEYYLGRNFHTTKDKDGIQYMRNNKQSKHLSHKWAKHNITTAFSAQTYIYNALERLERMLGKEFKLYTTPMADSTHSELDDSPLFSLEDHSKFRSLVGCANWLITLGRFDIAYAVNAFSRFSMQPRHRHLVKMERIFGYLKKFHKGKIMIDPNLSLIHI